jgi:hypothetical protein
LSTVLYVCNAALFYVMLMQRSSFTKLNSMKVFVLCGVCSFHLLLGADRLLLATSVLLAASLETVGADLEEASVGGTCSVGASLDCEGLGGLVGTDLVLGAPRVTAGVALAAATEAV